MPNSRFAFLALALLLSACAGQEKLTLVPRQYEDLNGWQAADHTRAARAFATSCEALMKRSRGASAGLQMGTVADWEPACNAAAAPMNALEARQFFETYFRPFKSISSRRPDGLFTGYYELELNGSLKRTSRFRYPLYRKPPEHLRDLTRAEIENGGLKGQGLELAWVDDPVRLFFLQIQGSGILRLPGGKTMRVGFDAHNSQEYVSLGRWLIDNGYMEKDDVTAPAIKQWLYNNPDLATQAMQQNPSYVFFRFRNELAHYEGPIGAQNVPLTPYGSLAVDKRFYGYGLPVWIETTLPEIGAEPERPFNRLLIAQDTGGAIRGAIRGDIFFGRGQSAEQLAGYTKQRGNMWILLPLAVAQSHDDE